MTCDRSTKPNKWQLAILRPEDEDPEQEDKTEKGKEKRLKCSKNGNPIINYTDSCNKNLKWFMESKKCMTILIE